MRNAPDKTQLANEQLYLGVLTSDASEDIYRCKTLFDILCWCAPPLTLIKGLEKQQERQPIPPEVATWLDKWRRLRSGEPVPELEEVHT